MSKEFPLIKIKWLDSVSSNSIWSFKDVVLPPDEITTVAFLIADEKDYISIAHSYGTAQVAGLLTIPKVSIISRKNLK